MENGFYGGLQNKPKLGSDVMANTIEDAAAMIVENAMTGAIHIAMDSGPEIHHSEFRGATFMSPSTTDSGITMMTNGMGKDIEFYEHNGSTTTETSALSEVTDNVAQDPVISHYIVDNPESSQQPALVDLSDIGLISSSVEVTTASCGAVPADYTASAAETAGIDLDFAVDDGAGDGFAAVPAQMAAAGGTPQEEPKEEVIIIWTYGLFTVGWA